MKHRGFTIIELLVVIGILGLLMATLVYTIGGGTESARAAQCKANLKSLANACSAVVAADTEWHRYPLAGSIEHMDMVNAGNNQYRKAFTEQKGWVSWNSDGTYKNKPQSHAASASWFTSCYDSNIEARQYCLTNGAVWSAMSGSADSYRCPNHVKVCSEKVLPNWSYVMNAWFGWDSTQGSGPRAFWGRSANDSGIRADKRLLFAELQWTDYTGDQPDFSAGSGLKHDCTLQYRNCTKGVDAEAIGFNHKSGRDVVAHVVYADGHVGEIFWKDGQDLKELTEWLCEAKDIAIDSSSDKYKEMQ